MAQLGPGDHVLNMPQGAGNTGGLFHAIRDEEQHEFPDSSAPLFNMYRRMTEEEERGIATRWQKDANGILIFTGLFSASVSVLLAVTVLDLKPNPQEKSAFYLENIYQLLADGNISRPSIPVTRVEYPPFSVPNHLILVNSLWFLSLIISLTCAMLATMIQQWARRYLRIIQRPRHSPHDGARISAFFARGVKQLRFQWVAEAIPALIHISLFLFFIGLLIYLFNTNHAVFSAVFWWVGVSALSYLLITIMPILRVDSPYYSPLSTLAFRLYAVLLYSLRCPKLAATYFSGFSRGIEKLAGTKVIKEPWKFDSFILKWTFDAHAFASDDQLDQFFGFIPGYYNSTQVDRDPVRSLVLSSRKFSWALAASLKRALSSNSVTESDKIRRFIMCVKIADETKGEASLDLFSVATKYSFLRTAQVGLSLRSRTGEIGLCAQTLVAGTIANVEESDDRWIELAADQLGKSKTDIRRYLAQGNDNVLLANSIHIARQISGTSSGTMASDAAEFTLQLPSQFDIRNTLPELQRDFCSLWNEIVLKAQRSGDGSVPHFIIFLLRNLYRALHQDIDDAQASPFDKFKVSSYPLCNNPHQPSHGTVTADTDAPPHVTSSPLSAETNRAPDPPEQVAGTSMTPQDNMTPVDLHTIVPDSAALLPSSQLTGNPHLPVVGSSVNSFDSSTPGQASSSPVTTFLPVHSQVPSSSDPGGTATTSTGILRVDEDTLISSISELPGQPHHSLAESSAVTTTSGPGSHESSQSPT